MKEFQLEDGDMLFIVKPNTTEDPIRVHQQCKAYNPLMIEELKVASSFYKYKNSLEQNRTVFDVYGTHGTKNKGQKDGTRMVDAFQNGIDTPDDDTIKPFRTMEDAIVYKNLMLNDENFDETLEITLERWGISDIKGFKEIMLFKEDCILLSE
jgi:hypothetical protein